MTLEKLRKYLVGQGYTEIIEPGSMTLTKSEEYNKTVENGSDSISLTNRYHRIDIVSGPRCRIRLITATDSVLIPSKETVEYLRLMLAELGFIPKEWAIKKLIPECDYCRNIKEWIGEI